LLLCPVLTNEPVLSSSAVLLQQVMAMPQEQIDALPEVTRAQVLQVKQLLGARQG
jgi:hypothetical protein